MSPNGDMNTSKAELAVLKHLWSHRTQSMREIHNAVSTELNWSRSSTRKTIERMVGKGMITCGDSHGLNVYTAKIKKIPTLANMVRRFAAEVLGLEGPLPVSSLLKSHFLTSDELKELDDFLKEMAEKEHKE